MLHVHVSTSQLRVSELADARPRVANSGGFQFRLPRVPGQVERQRHVTIEQEQIT